jgi:hypothetical protein
VPHLGPLGCGVPGRTDPAVPGETEGWEGMSEV